MKRYGCIGKKLTHSFSREIHARLADYSYELIELEEGEVRPFLEKRDFAAINVTIPYKQTVIPHLDEVSDIARRIGAVNTIVNREGALLGYNTDYYGMRALISRMGLDIKGKKVLVLGTGGTGKTARVVCEDLGAAEILTVSRRKSCEYIDYTEAQACHTNAEIIINTTPSGMYPDCEGRPIDISKFIRLQGVVDAIYNPLRSNLVLDAMDRGIKAEGGLYMLVMQAVVAVEKFLDTSIEKSVAERVFAEVLLEKESIVLTGMPGSGKSTVARLIRLDGYDRFDTDEQIEHTLCCAIKEIIENRGESFFRDTESEVIREVSSVGSRIISTGGGVPLREENIRRLRRNGRIFFYDANPTRLRATADRPLSDTADKLLRLYNERIEIYKATADVIVPDMSTPEAAAAYILAKRQELTV